ncbi:hypothetical protein [Saccharothrix australiensis]|uniref:hypothetical protein n=1 Tax=Saccharothrix australiensis TaxID=2072 RepID=UPI000EB06E76|nr:hypothetical protein [Saccharothrix australiensis]
MRLTVKAHDARARALWAVVAEDPVLVARVRGALAGLKAEFRGHRDEVMWLLWINQAQQQLTPSHPEPVEAAAAAPRTAEPEALPPAAEHAEPGPDRSAHDLTPSAVAVEEHRPERAARDIPVMLFQEPPSATR